MSAPELLLLIPLLSGGSAILFRRWSRFSKVVNLGSLILLIIILVFTKVSSPGDGTDDLQFITSTWQTYFGLMSVGTIQRSLLAVLYIGMGTLTALTLLLDQGWIFTSLNQFLLASLTGLLLSNSSTTSALFVLLGSATLTILTQGPRPGSTLASFRSFSLAVIAFPGLLTTNYLLGARPVDFFNWTPFFLLVIILILLLSFPFQIWVPSIVSEARSFVPAVAYGLVQLVLLLYLLGIIAENPIVFRNNQLLQLLGISGVITVIFAIILMLNVSTIRRLLGYLVVLDLGTTTMALSLGANLGLELAIFIVINRSLGLMIAGVALGMVGRANVVELGDRNSVATKTKGNRSPLAVGLLVYGFASTAGLPLTPGFASRWALIKASSVQSSWQATVVVVAMIVATVVMIRLFMLRASNWRREVSGDEIIPSAFRNVTIIMFLVGILITILSPIVLSFARALLDGI